MITYDTYFIDEPIDVYYNDTLLGTVVKHVYKTPKSLSLIIDHLSVEHLRNSYKIPSKCSTYFNGTDVVIAKKRPSLDNNKLIIPYYLEGNCNGTPIKLSDNLYIPIQQVKDNNQLTYTLDQLTPILKPTPDFPKLHVTHCAYLQKGLYLTIEDITCPSVIVKQKPYKKPSALGHNFRPSVILPKS